LGGRWSGREGEERETDKSGESYTGKRGRIERRVSREAFFGGKR